MTGHGRGATDRATVEIRAVNNRYFDLKLRGASDPRVEEAVAGAIRKRAERGSFAVAIRTADGARGGVRVDPVAAAAALAALDELRRTIGSSDPVPLALVAAQPGVLVAGDAHADPDAALAAVLPAVDAALAELVAMRRTEGAALATEMNERIEKIVKVAGEIAELAAAAPEEGRRRLAERLDKLGATVDPARLAQEIALLADRLDITEELVRLRTHAASFRALLAEDAPVGRKLDFLVQELGREINTIGSKSQSAEITRRVVDLKAELEKIREQAQNVE
jgi:uncharacterized protein (TIGR00255 family)